MKFAKAYSLQSLCYLKVCTCCGKYSQPSCRWHSVALRAMRSITALTWHNREWIGKQYQYSLRKNLRLHSPMKFANIICKYQYYMCNMEAQQLHYTNKQTAGGHYRVRSISFLNHFSLLLHFSWGGRGRWFKSSHSDQKSGVVRFPIFILFPRKFSRNLVFSQ